MAEVAGSGEADSSEFPEAEKFLIIGLLSHAADLAELRTKGSVSYLYAEIEAAAKVGGLRKIKELRHQDVTGYSVSDIAPNDLEGT